MNLSEIKEECLKLDLEYRKLFDQILGMLGKLSTVSLEFVNSKLSFLECYSLTFQDSHLDARHHRNNQLKNLLEYIETHKQMQIRSTAPSPQKISKSIHSTRRSVHDSDKSINVPHKQRSSAFYQDFNNATSNMSLMLNNIVPDKQNDKQCKNEQALLMLHQVMKLLEANQQFYVSDYQLLNKEYQTLIRQNDPLLVKRNLELESNRLKDNLNCLMESQRTFKQYLNSIK